MNTTNPHEKYQSVNLSEDEIIFLIYACIHYPATQNIHYPASAHNEAVTIRSKLIETFKQKVGWQ